MAIKRSTDLFCSRVACPIWMVFLLPVLQVDLWISTCSMYCSPRIFSIEGWGGCCLFRGGVVIVLQGAALPPIPGIGSGDVRDLCFSLFLSLLLFRQVRSGRMGSDGLPWRPKCVICFSFLRCLGSSYWTGSWRSSWENLPVLSPHWGGHSVSTMKQHKKSARCTLNVWCTDWRVQHWGGVAMHWMKTGWNCVLARRVLLCTSMTLLGKIVECARPTSGLPQPWRVIASLSSPQLETIMPEVAPHCRCFVSARFMGASCWALHLSLSCPDVCALYSENTPIVHKALGVDFSPWATQTSGLMSTYSKVLR